MKHQLTPPPHPPGQLNLLPQAASPSPIGFWPVPATITENHFIYKSLSSFAFNLAVGCSHGCQFCFVPDTSTRKQAPALARYGVQDPDAEWGNYVLLRPWDENKFLTSLAKAERTPKSALKRDGNRAIIYCSTTDAYQTYHHPDPEQRRILAAHAQHVVRRSLELIRDHSTLNVRILTRSPLARRDFDLYQSLGHRLTFGMSLPTLRNDLAKAYEPKAPAPSQRLATLREAREAGLHVFVAMAPTYPECDAADLEATLTAVVELDPITIFHEPINVRAENVARIAAHAMSIGVPLNTSVFATTTDWRRYALEALHTVERLANKLGVADRLHLWPDQSLGSRAALSAMVDPVAHQDWLDGWWSRISAWPLPATSGQIYKGRPTGASSGGHQ